MKLVIIKQFRNYKEINCKFFDIDFEFNITKAEIKIETLTFFGVKELQRLVKSHSIIIRKFCMVVLGKNLRNGDYQTASDGFQDYDKE